MSSDLTPGTIRFAGCATKDLNQYGKDVMSAQSELESIETSISTTEAALASLKSDRDGAVDVLAKAKAALQDATDRVKNGDYGAEADGNILLSREEAEEARARAFAAEEDEFPKEPVTGRGSEPGLSDDFEGINQTPPGEPDTPSTENRTLASNGAGV